MRRWPHRGKKVCSALYTSGSSFTHGNVNRGGVAMFIRSGWDDGVALSEVGDGPVSCKVEGLGVGGPSRGASAPALDAIGPAARAGCSSRASARLPAVQREALHPAAVPRAFYWPREGPATRRRSPLSARPCHWAITPRARLGSCTTRPPGLVAAQRWCPATPLSGLSLGPNPQPAQGYFPPPPRDSYGRLGGC